MVETTYQAGALNPHEHDKITAFVDQAPPYETLMMRAAARHPDAFGGWWHGAFAQGGELRALASVAPNNVASLYSVDQAATATLGDSMGRAASGRAASSGTHQILGPEAVVGDFWDRFQRAKRTLVNDRLRDLMSITTSPATKAAYAVVPATMADLKLVAEFSAEYSVEQWGMDPRRASKEGHEKRCAAGIEAGIFLVGRQRGKPVFIGERHMFEAGMMMLDGLYIPRPMRRPRVAAGILAHALTLVLQDADEAVLFMDTGQEAWMEAANTVGLDAKARYRLLILR